MRPVIKMQEVVGEGRGEEAGTGRALRRRLDEAGAAVQDETRLLRAHAAAQALAIQGMEQTRGIGEQLVQAKLRIAELTAEMKKKDAVMQEKERYYCELMQSKDAVIQSKDVALQEKVSHFGKLIKCKDELLQLEDAEIRRLQADLARLSAEVAAGGTALHLPVCILLINDHVLSKCQCDVAARAILHSHTRCLLYSTCLSARVYSPTSGFSRFQFTIFFSMSLRTRQP